jgi:hypothetical protein
LIGLTVIVTALLVAVADVTQLNEEVITQVITSPFTNAALEYVVEFVPTFAPFNFHW